MLISVSVVFLEISDFLAVTVLLPVMKIGCFELLFYNLVYIIFPS